MRTLCTNRTNRTSHSSGRPGALSLVDQQATPPERAVVVLPTYDEADNIVRVLASIRQSAPDLDVLVVDDESPDGTAALAAATGDVLGQIDVLRRGAKSGLGAAYRAGFAVALSRGYQIVIEMDADLSHDAAALPALVDAVRGGADLAIGSRYVPGGATPGWPTARRLLSRAGNRYAAAVLDLDVTDLTSGFRAYRAGTLRTAEFAASRSTGYGFQIELAYAVACAGGTIREVPIVFRDRTRGHSKMSARITSEALAGVTWWAVRDRVLRLATRHRASAVTETRRSGLARPATP